MTQLAKMFASVLQTPELMAEAARWYKHEMSRDESGSIPTTATDDIAATDGMDENGFGSLTVEEFGRNLMSVQLKRNPEVLPSVRLSCANVDREKDKACSDPGTKACSGCKLVSYCSRVSIRCLSRSFPSLIVAHYRSVKECTGGITNKVCSQSYDICQVSEIHQTVKIRCSL
jgi:hypothetical protein